MALRRRYGSPSAASPVQRSKPTRPDTPSTPCFSVIAIHPQNAHTPDLPGHTSSIRPTGVYSSEDMTASASGLGIFSCGRGTWVPAHRSLPREIRPGFGHAPKYSRLPGLYPPQLLCGSRPGRLGNRESQDQFLRVHARPLCGDSSHLRVEIPPGAASEFVEHGLHGIRPLVAS